MFFGRLTAHCATERRNVVTSTWTHQPASACLESATYEFIIYLFIYLSIALPNVPYVSPSQCR